MKLRIRILALVTVIVLVASAAPAAFAATPSLSLIRVDYALKKITGIPDGAQYAVYPSTAFVDIGATEMDIDGAQPLYGVRLTFKLSATSPKTRNLLIQKKSPPPSAFYDYGLESFVGLSTAFEYSLNGGPYTQLTAANPAPPVSETADNTFLIRRKAIPSRAESESKTVIIPKRPSAPDVTGFYVNGTDGVLKIDAGRELYEVSLDNGAKWQRIGPMGTNVNYMLLKEQYNVLIRLKAREILKDRDTCSGETHSYAATFNMGPPPAKPAGAYDSATESITGLTADTEYRRDTMTRWLPVDQTALEFSIVPFIPINSAIVDNKVQVRIKGTGTGIPSVPQVFTIKKRPPAPLTPAFDFLTETVTGIDNTMEYRLGAAGPYTAVAAGQTTLDAIAADPGVKFVQFRKKAGFDASSNTITPASLSRAVAIPPVGVSPMFRFSYLTMKITNLKITQEYQFRTNVGVEAPVWYPVTRDIVRDGLTITDETAVAVRTKAVTAGAHARKSAEQTMTFQQAQSVPLPAITLIKEQERITGPLGAWEMRMAGSSDAYAPASTSVSIEKYLDMAANAVSAIEFRLKAAAMAPASLPVTYTIGCRSDAPAGVAYNGTTRTINTTSDMEYNIGQKWIDAPNTLNVANVYPPNGGYIDVKIRYKALPDNYASKYTTVRVYLYYQQP